MSTTPTTMIPIEWQELAQKAVNAKENAYCKFYTVRVPAICGDKRSEAMTGWFFLLRFTTISLLSPGPFKHSHP